MSRKFDVRRAGSGAVLAGCWMLLSGGADPVAAVSKSLTFNPLTASVMQGSLDAGPNRLCNDGEAVEDYRAHAYQFRGGNPNADYLYQSYELYNNGPARCVRVTSWWLGTNCEIEIGLSLYLGSFNPSDPTENLLAHSYEWSHEFLQVGDEGFFPNDYRHSPGYYRDELQNYHLDGLNFATAVVPALAKVIVVLDSHSQPGSTTTCPTPGYAYGFQSNQLTDKVIAVEVSDTSNYEFNPPGGANLSFYVSLTSQLAVPLSVNFATSPGSAGAGSDYTTTNGTLTFQPGETTKLVQVPIVSDLTQEVPATETMTLTLSAPNPVGVTLADATATGTIYDDDDPNANCGIKNVVGAGDLPVGVVASPYGPVALEPTGAGVALAYEFSLASGALPPGIDLTTGPFPPSNGILSGTPTQAGIFNFMVGLRCPESDNGHTDVQIPFTLIVEAQAANVLITVGDATVVEGNVGPTDALPGVTLSAALPTDLLLEISTFDGSAAILDTDYPPLPANQLLLIPAGTTFEPIPLQVTGDLKVEEDENYSVEVRTEDGSDVLGIGTVTIVNDDVAVISVPTLGEWGFWVLAAGLAGLGLLLIRRR